mmetsp:Transcript_10547/g.17215  ORF Transcript_10547/g.17215 Transcript_10547/m.17215 type:complete len:254 (+) Transcript_10547:566-1327(+)|eukprot:CAMPEP_0203776552 /NCGR_PEP_ID=MMETSP0099_2-20121227/6817_1 /ASSEMBLY_ACC=CAM_ASM_000209 /TAXON_ID=96639 /ORGANISM=" , Strain NY0313808BC1" /LENGTH=253 /DNA_ID=CAMNT_0050675587 /DNA_START=435 /DNA_END=1196 /DNA_ORIENTATION=-
MAEAPLNAPLIGSHSDDPFYAFKDELETRVEEASTRFFKWKGLLERENTATSREFKEENGALKRELNSLQSNVSDLEQVLQRVQTHRSNFAHISDNELASRQGFIRQVKGEVNKMKSTMSSPQTLGKIDQDNKKELLRQKNTEKSNDDTNTSFIENQQMQQMQVMRQQDEHLDELEQGASRLGYMATAIGEEIDSQNLMLDQLGDDIEATQGRMESVLGRMDKMLKTNDRCQTWTILSLIMVLIVLVILVAWT